MKIAVYTAVVVAIIAGIWLLWSAQNKMQSSISAREINSDSSARWDTFVNSRLGFSFEYPPNLTLDEDQCAEDPTMCLSGQEHILTLFNRNHEWMDLFYSADFATALSSYDSGAEKPDNQAKFENLDSYFLTRPHRTTTISAGIPAYVSTDANSRSIWFEHDGIYIFTITDQSIFESSSSRQLSLWEEAIFSTFAFTR